MEHVKHVKCARTLGLALLLLGGAAHATSVVDRFVNQNTLAAETVDPVGPTGGTSRIIRSHHVQDGHSLRYYALAQVSTLPVDDLRVNYQQSYRFAIHLRPPQSFGGKWK